MTLNKLSTDQIVPSRPYKDTRGTSCPLPPMESVANAATLFRSVAPAYTDDLITGALHPDARRSGSHSSSHVLRHPQFPLLQPETKESLLLLPAPPSGSLNGPSAWDRSTIEVNGNLLIPSLSDCKDVFNFSTPVWIQCNIVHVVYEDAADASATRRYPRQVSNSEASTQSSSVCSTKRTPASTLLQSVEKQEASHVMVTCSSDPSRYFSIPTHEAYIPLPMNAADHCSDPIAPSALLEALVPGVDVEVFTEVPYVAWLPGKVRRVYQHDGATQVEFLVLTVHTKLRVATMLASKTRWRLANEQRVTVADLGGVVKEVFDWYRPEESSATSNWDDDENLLDIVREKANLLKAMLVPTTSPPRLVCVGLDHDIATARAMLLSLLGAGGSDGSPTPLFQQERRQRRFKFLADRRETYAEKQMIEFSVNDTFIGTVIGRQGEKLSRVAKDLQVELRVLPEDNGMRRIRVYGKQLDHVQRARDALELVYQQILLNQSFFDKLKEEKETLKMLSQRSGLHSTCLNAKRHVLILCGTRRSLDAFRNRLHIFSQYPSDGSATNYSISATSQPDVPHYPAHLQTALYHNNYNSCPNVHPVNANPLSSGNYLSSQRSRTSGHPLSPVKPTSFVKRRRELAQVEQLTRFVSVLKKPDA